MPDPRPCLVFYCQHSLGIGHLTRSFALVEALAPHFRVVFLNGGRLPEGIRVPQDMRRIDLPPLGMDDGHTVISRGGEQDVQAVRRQRSALIEQALREHPPEVLVVELFPFGRKKFAGEILPMLRAARRQAGGPALIACSLRDILVHQRPDQLRHDDRARGLTDRYFDLVLTHTDPALADLGESFKPSRPLRTPVQATGYVVPHRPPALASARGPHLLVSAGGGIVGGELLRCALAARRLLATPPPLRLIAGPFLPETEWQSLRQEARHEDGVTLLRQVSDMVAEMRTARASISQCGYNTALDLIVAQVPALVVPYRTVTEDEQSVRAQRLARQGALLDFGPAPLEPQGLARAMEALLEFTPRASAIALDGAERSAQALRAALAARRTPHEASPCPA